MECPWYKCHRARKCNLWGHMIMLIQMNYRLNIIPLENRLTYLVCPLQLICFKITYKQRVNWSSFIETKIDEIQMNNLDQSIVLSSWKPRFRDLVLPEYLLIKWKSNCSDIVNEIGMHKTSQKLIKEMRNQ